MYDLGIHLILVPKSGYMVALSDKILAGVIPSALSQDTDDGEAGFIEGKVLQDHVHVLIGCKANFDAANCIEKIVQTLKHVEQTLNDPDFEFEDGVHVTLLPPWHLEILASFVRDQDNYHKTRTLEMELDEVFRPNAQPQL